jgi:hypothetical protein
VEEHGAAPTSHSRPRIVVDLNNEVIERIFTPKPVAWFIGRPAKWLVVTPVAGVLAPSVSREDATER